MAEKGKREIDLVELCSALESSSLSGSGMHDGATRLSLLHRRVEFISNFGLGSKLIAFVDFSGQGISLGAALSGALEDEEGKLVWKGSYSRFTVHTDGKTVHHGGYPAHQYCGHCSPLAQWNDQQWIMTELCWQHQANRSYLERYLAKPGRPRADILYVEVHFTPSATSTKICLVVPKPNNAKSLGELCQILDLTYPAWALSSAWPQVLVFIENVTGCYRLNQLSSVGRDYRRCE